MSNNSNQLLVVINSCSGAFGISDIAVEWLIKRGLSAEEAIDFQNDNCWDKRSNPLLVECVQTLGYDASEYYAELEVVEVDNDYGYRIGEYDGYEYVTLVPKASKVTYFVECGDTKGLMEYLQGANAVVFE